MDSCFRVVFVQSNSIWENEDKEIVFSHNLWRNQIVHSEAVKSILKIITIVKFGCMRTVSKFYVPLLWEVWYLILCSRIQMRTCSSTMVWPKQMMNICSYLYRTDFGRNCFVFVLAITRCNRYGNQFLNPHHLWHIHIEGCYLCITRTFLRWFIW